MIELARAGTCVKQLAKTFGLSEATIYSWLEAGLDQQASKQQHDPWSGPPPLAVGGWQGARALWSRRQQRLLRVDQHEREIVSVKALAIVVHPGDVQAARDHRLAREPPSRRP